MQFYHKCEKTVTGTLCSGIVVHYGQNTHLIKQFHKMTMNFDRMFIKFD
jgi:hypothetical protein